MRVGTNNQEEMQQPMEVPNESMEVPNEPIEVPNNLTHPDEAASTTQFEVLKIKERTWRRKGIRPNFREFNFTNRYF